MNYKQIAQDFIRVVEKEYKEDVAVAALDMTGAGYNQEADKIFFVPKTQNGFTLEKSFLIKDETVQIQACTWDELENILSGDREKAGILAEAQLLYACDDTEKGHFESLCCKAKSFENNIPQCEKILQECKNLCFLFTGSDCSPQETAVRILKKAICLLMLYHNKYLKGSWSMVQQEVKECGDIPESFRALTETVSQSADAQELQKSCCQLVWELQKMLTKSSVSGKEKNTGKEVLKGKYEAAQKQYRNIINAAFSGDALGTLLYAEELQREIEEIEVRTGLNFPLENLLDLYYRKDLMSFAVAMYTHEAGMMGFILNQGIQFEQYANIERFEEEYLPKD